MNPIALEVIQGLIEVGESISGKPLYCTLRIEETEEAKISDLVALDPWEVDGLDSDDVSPSAPSYVEFVGVESIREVRDASGTLTGVSRRTLTLGVSTEEPLKSHQIAVGVKAIDADADSPWEEISEVRPLSPTGDVLLYEVDLVS